MVTIFDDDRRKKRKAEERERAAHQKIVEGLYDTRAETIVEYLWRAKDSYGEHFVAVNQAEFYQKFTADLQHVHGEYRNVPGTEAFRQEVMRFVDEQRHGRLVDLLQETFKTKATEWQWV